MKIELVQKMSMEIVSTEPLEVRISMIAECGEEAISFEKTIKALEEFAQFTANASSWMEQFCAGKATTFIKDRFFGGKNEKPTA